MTPLESQIATLLGLTGTGNVLDAIEHVKILKRLLDITEQQRKDWADQCIKSHAKIKELRETEDYLNEIMSEYRCDYESLNQCVTKVLAMTDNEKIKELINHTVFRLCANMK